MNVLYPLLVETGESVRIPMDLISVNVQLDTKGGTALRTRMIVRFHLA
jgi:hypothetical protein